MSLIIEHDSDAHRFRALAEDAEVGTVDYELAGTVATVTHTWTDAARRGEGIAATLTAGVLDEVRRRGWTVVPQCPYTARFLADHAEYQDLLYPSGG